MMFLAVILVVILLVQDALLWLLLKFSFKDYVKNEVSEFPFVSILIPSRNEEENLPACLKSIAKLNYPKDKLQIILGNDRSTDETGVLLKTFEDQNEHVKLVQIQEGDSSKMNGKANALSQMAKYAKGEVLLFTDADCQVPSNWVRSMVLACQNTEAGIITGITHIKADNIYGKMQGMDWWLTLGMVKVMSDFGYSVTSMGNNMLITKASYLSVGGFESIPFSLTEDFEIARNIQSKGYKVLQQVSEDNLISTKSQNGFSQLIQQRKRWMSGAMSLPLYWRLILAIQVLFFPSILLLVFLHPLLAICLWIAKVLIQGLFIYSFAIKTKIKLAALDLFLFEIYYMITSWSTILYYFWPSKTEWKGRRY
ncbi:glycosyltransferase [Aquiflexum sp.]|uniref:glycosyltransferase n=1 Tax=Aquiflexum sp. TaxID=1872584 RepID=UPI00359365AB